MVRTKADRVPTKAVGGKVAGKVVSTGTPCTGKRNKSRKTAGKSRGNLYHPRETPKWQKPITSFMNTDSKTTTSNVLSVEERIENQASNSNYENPNTEGNTTEEESETD